MNLDGKAVLITGGRRVGAALARMLADRGARLAMTYRTSREAIESALDDCRSRGAEGLAVEADLAIPEQADRAVARVVERFGRIDALVNNAGLFTAKPWDELTLEDWRERFRVNVEGTFLATKAVEPAMTRQGGGKIINIGSMTSIFGSSFAPAYATSKGGIVQLTKSMALAWAPDRIQVNAILPGWFDTELTEKARQEIPGLHERVLARIPHGRWAKPDDMAGTAVWLASPASDYVTGIVVPVDGGYTSAL